MSKIFETDSDSDDDFKTDNQYAKRYDIWRKEEEINKLKTKYGDDVNLDENEDLSSSSSDDEEGSKITDEVEKEFFKTLACLKNKDPRIYDENIKFFQDDGNENVLEKNRTKKNAPIYTKDHEGKMILEKREVFTDDEENFGNKQKNSSGNNYKEEESLKTNYQFEPLKKEYLEKLTTYVDEQKFIKESINNADEEDDENNGVGLLKKKETQEEQDKESAGYKKWLVGEKKEIDKEVESELKPLKDYWNSPNLEEGEQFLRDYILKKKFLDKSNDDYIRKYDDVIHDSDQDLSNDEETIDKQEQFEHKYNFRFEEPDQEFIKRYPRTMENSVRKKDDRRKLKRQETKERKMKEKEEKMQELKKLQELKRKEIEEKLEKLKEITGNSSIGFGDEDIEGDFDPEAHDKRMQALFNDDYYQGSEEEQKPAFPEIDEELDIETWDRYENEDESQNTPHCEDNDFNMDCDYDPSSSTQKELIENSKGKKKRKRKSKVAEALSRPKPKFDPNDKNYEKYFDEYYKLDCEDIIGGIPCRFKYRTVVPNDFGLSVEEILLAKERELNKWCALKKAIQFRPDHVEKYEQIAYKKKAQNINLKKRIIPSLFTPDPEEQNVENAEKDNKANISVSVGNKNNESNSIEEQTSNVDTSINHNSSGIHKRMKKKKNNNKKPKTQNSDVLEGLNKVKKQKLDLHSTVETRDAGKIKTETTNEKSENNKIEHTNEKQKKERKRKLSTNANEINITKKKSKKNKDHKKNKQISISDARLSAYGINPKKFKNKLKYRSK